MTMMTYPTREAAEVRAAERGPGFEAFYVGIRLWAVGPRMDASLSAHDLIAIRDGRKTLRSAFAARKGGDR